MLVYFYNKTHSLRNQLNISYIIIYGVVLLSVGMVVIMACAY